MKKKAKVRARARYVEEQTRADYESLNVPKEFNYKTVYRVAIFSIKTIAQHVSRIIINRIIIPRN